MENIERKFVVDIETGLLDYSYYYKNNEVGSRYLKGPRTNQYIGYDLILHDLSDAKLWISTMHRIIDNHGREQSKNQQDNYLKALAWQESDILKGLFVASVSYYGKCFSRAKGRRIKLERSNVPKEFLETHDKFITFRNTIVAHSGMGDWDNGQLAAIKPDGFNQSQTTLWSELERLQCYDDRGEEYSFAKLIDYLSNETNDKLISLRKSILENES